MSMPLYWKTLLFLIILLENNIDVGSGIGGSREGEEKRIAARRIQTSFANTQSEPLNYT